jgi:hypothetical protein
MDDALGQASRDSPAHALQDEAPGAAPADIVSPPAGPVNSSVHVVDREEARSPQMGGLNVQCYNYADNDDVPASAIYLVELVPSSTGESQQGFALQDGKCNVTWFPAIL